MKRKYLKELLFIIVGAAIAACAINFFLVPAEISSGGFSGIATILHIRLGFPIGIVVAVMNLPLAIIAIKLLGGWFSVKSVIATALFSLFLGIIPEMKITSDPIISCVYGGLVLGLGLGIVLKVNSTTGGSDLMARLLKLRFKHFGVGRLIFAVDFFVIVASGIFISPEKALYSLAAVFISTQIIDLVVSGFNNAKAFFIISREHEKIAQTIMEKLSRGVTSLGSRGMYTGTSGHTLLCVVQGASESATLQSLVKDIDRHAFLIKADAREVMGEGFAQLD